LGKDSSNIFDEPPGKEAFFLRLIKT